jgi:hypothetical protein
VTIAASPTTEQPLDEAALAKLFRQFARTECPPSELYDRLCRSAADEPALLQLLAVAAPEQRRPNLLLAAVHDLVLAGDVHPLAAYFQSVGGQRPADEALHACFVDFCAARRGELLARIAGRTTQTNEIGRCAVLWPVLREIVARSGRPHVALFDFGCSAGLNLGVDAYAYDYGEFRLGAAPSPQVPCIGTRLIGPHRPRAHGVTREPLIVERLGVDPAPIDVADEAEVRWLQACLWPHDALRRARFDEAVRLARQRRWPVQRAADCTAAMQRWVEGLAPELLPVVFNSWVLTYLPRDALARHVASIEVLVQQRGAVWVSAEGPSLRIGAVQAPPLPADATAEQRAGSLWTVAMAGAAAPRHELFARSHPHGKWLEWLLPDRP